MRLLLLLLLLLLRSTFKLLSLSNFCLMLPAVETSIKSWFRAVFFCSSSVPCKLLQLDVNTCDDGPANSKQ